jgi:hypothetical protein
MRVQLTERDERLLVDLYYHGAMLRGQIQQLHFPDCQLRRVNRRLQALHQSRLIVGSPLPLGPLSVSTPATSPGIGGQWVYRLGSQAAHRVGARLGVDIALVRKRVRQGTPTALTHALEIVQARVTLCRCPSLTLEEFLPEVRHSWKARLTDGQETLESFRPDARIRGWWQGVPLLVFLEVDLGHTSREEWRRKCEIAGRFLSSGLFARNYGTVSPFHIWTLTTTQNRARALQRAADSELPDVYRFTTLESFAQDPLSLVAGTMTCRKQEVGDDSLSALPTYCS